MTKGMSRERKEGKTGRKDGKERKGKIENRRRLLNAHRGI
jgi:hypothetical protein